MVARTLSNKKAVALFHALSDETRLALRDWLKEGKRCACELTDAMKAAQSRLLFHTESIQRSGIVGIRQEPQTTLQPQRSRPLPKHPKP